MENYKEYVHNPPHLFKNNSKYFITGSIYQKKNMLKSSDAKARLLKSLEIGFTSKGWNLEEWVILNNHYHILVESSKKVADLPNIMRDIHKFTAMWMKKNLNIAKDNKKIWWNYWDKCITFEKSYFSRINYIWYNPVKHNLIDRAELWEFGSFYNKCKQGAYVNELKTKYPCEKVNEKDDF
ncbi:MAG: transposase [Candidatus Cloacimonadota bacterium]|nr:transposase [Candidatus Cloacimonadota bacterium]